MEPTQKAPPEKKKSQITRFYFYFVGKARNVGSVLTVEEDDDGEQRGLSRPWEAGGEHVEVEAVLSAHQKAGFRTEYCHLKKNISWSQHVNSEKKKL